MRIAYLVNRYPTVSHSFIRREILALERRGVEVMRIALREWNPELLDAENQLERKRTRYVLRDGAPALLVALVRMLLTRPVRLLQALALALRMGYRGDRPLPVHLIYLAEACRIEPWLRAAGVQHLHAHFGTNSAEVAMLVHALGGPRWSFTVHGPKEYDNVQLIGLAEKIRRCAFVVAISSYGRSQLYRLVEAPALAEGEGGPLRARSWHISRRPCALPRRRGASFAWAGFASKKGNCCWWRPRSALPQRGIPIRTGAGRRRRNARRRSRR